jgi:hypothetical protein
MGAQEDRIASLEKAIRTLEAKIDVLQEQKDTMSDEKACLVENARAAWKAVEDGRAALLRAEKMTDRLLGVVERMAGGVRAAERTRETQE